jgi:predicted nucleic acid-binding protein
MSFSSDASKILVADASVVINLNATQCAAEIIGSLRGAMFVTENARLELEAGLRNGHSDAEKLRVLIKQGAVQVAHLGMTGLAIYETLIEGAAEQTLDDGEAATIAYACEIKGIAILDEKARSLSSARFPELTISSSAEMLACEAAHQKLGTQGQVDAIVNALRDGRMRVPNEHVDTIIKLIGETNAASCTSLPKRVKRSLNAR